MDTTFKRCYVLTEDPGSVFSPCHEDQSELQLEAEVILTLTLKLAVPPQPITPQQPGVINMCNTRCNYH